LLDSLFPEDVMMKLAVALATICTLATPALADVTTDKPITMAQVELRLGDRDRDYRRDHDRGRDVYIDRRGPRGFARDRDRDCRTVTVRERRGDRIVIKKFRRC
jgi:Ni/Co efflux regulator RcnB